MRVTKYYDASCQNGLSDYVDSGNAACVPANGINDGKFAEWVDASHLSKTRPADPALSQTGMARWLGGSDDFATYGNQFLKVGQKLLDKEYCTQDQLEHSGGFEESQNYKGRMIYFIICGEGKYYANLGTLDIYPQ